MTSDFRTSEPKRASRAFNIDGLRGSRHLAPPTLASFNHAKPDDSPPGPLRYDWMELAGEGAPTADLLAPLLSSRGRFLGVDQNEAVIARAQANPQPHCLYRAGRLEAVRFEEPEIVARVGILNFDSLSGWWGDKIVREVHDCAEFISDQIKRNRLLEFLLIVNAHTRFAKSQSDAETTMRDAFEPLVKEYKASLDLSPGGPNVLYYRARGGKSEMANVRMKIGYR